MFFFDNSEKTLRELLEVLSKGIDLLANDNLDANLYDAYEKYVISTIKLVDNAYLKNYTSRFEQTNNIGRYPFVSYTPMGIPHEPYQPLRGGTFLGNLGYTQQFGINRPTVNYKEKLKNLLQKITTVVKEITSE